MAKKKKVNNKNTQDFKIISIRKLAETSKIPYTKIYNCLRGKYNSMTDAEKTQLCNALYFELEPFGNFLGIDIILRRQASK